MLIAAYIVLGLVAIAALGGLWIALRDSKLHLKAPMDAGIKQAAQELHPEGEEMPTAEQIHSKYDAVLSTTDPKRAGKLKYMELLKIHGK